MLRRPLLPLAALLILLEGCSEIAWARLTAASDEGESEGEGSTTAAGDPSASAATSSTASSDMSTGGGDDATTTRGDESESASTTTSSTAGGASNGTFDTDAIDLPPEILDLNASPDLMLAAGPLTVTIEHSADVVEVEVWRGNKLLRAQPPDSSAWTTIQIPIVDHPDNLGAQDVAAIVRDAGGLEDAASESVTVMMPKAGTPLWHEQWDDELYAEGLAVAAIDDSTVTAGYRRTKTLEARPTMSAWTYGQGKVWSFNFLDLPFSSAIAALAERPGTNEFAVCGNLVKPGDPAASRPWVRIYNEQAPGPELWQDFQGSTTAVNAAAMTPGGDVIVAGSTVTAWQPATRDVAIWILPGHLLAYPAPLTWQTPNKVPKLNYPSPNDQALGVTILPEGDIIVIGETQAPVFELDWAYRRRALALRYSPDGALKESWIAPVLYGYETLALGVAPDPEGGVLIAGWTRTSKGDPTAPIVFCMSPTLAVTCAWSDDAKEIDTEARRLLSSSTGQLILGVNDASGAHRRARILGITDRESIGAPAWTYSVPVIDGLDVQDLRDLKIDSYGYIHYTGSASDIGVTVVHPFGGQIHG